MNGRALKIISGGQTGVDRAAFDVAIKLGIPCSGWCPRGRLAEDGVINEKYPLKETPTEVYGERTEWNVRDSDGTLILYIGELEGGTLLTAEMANKYEKPVFFMKLDEETNKSKFLDWMNVNKISALNVAGHRESHFPGVIYKNAFRVIDALLSDLS